MVEKTEHQPDEPRRVRAFANFFKRYMSLSTVIVAALPIPVAWFGLIPTFEAQTAFLSTYTSLFCFLLLGFIFYNRHQLARLMFPEYFGGQRSPPKTPEFFKKIISWHHFVAALPAMLIVVSMSCVFKYHEVLNSAISYGRTDIIEKGLVDVTQTSTWVPSKDVLLLTDLSLITHSHELVLYYLGIFLAAEAAFILMAIKEYLQDLVGLGEMDLIMGPS